MWDEPGELFWTVLDNISAGHTNEGADVMCTDDGNLAKRPVDRKQKYPYEWASSAGYITLGSSNIF